MPLTLNKSLTNACNAHATGKSASANSGQACALQPTHPTMLPGLVLVQTLDCCVDFVTPAFIQLKVVERVVEAVAVSGVEGLVSTTRSALFLWRDVQFSTYSCEKERLLLLLIDVRISLHLLSNCSFIEPQFASPSTPSCGSVNPPLARSLRKQSCRSDVSPLVPEAIRATTSRSPCSFSSLTLSTSAPSATPLSLAQHHGNGMAILLATRCERIWSVELQFDEPAMTWTAVWGLSLSNTAQGAQHLLRIFIFLYLPIVINLYCTS